MGCPGIRNSFFAGIKFSLFLLELLPLLLPFHVNRTRTARSSPASSLSFLSHSPSSFHPLLLPRSFLFAKQFLLCSLRFSPTTNLPSSFQQSTSPSSLLSSHSHHQTSPCSLSSPSISQHLVRPEKPNNNRPHALPPCFSIMFFKHASICSKHASIPLQYRFNTASITLQSRSNLLQSAPRRKFIFASLLLAFAHQRFPFRHFGLRKCSR
ncbi:hypothetical protein HDV63DRAFT_374440 [Trichoderma sp. SZMC 28014]